MFIFTSKKKKRLHSWEIFIENAANTVLIFQSNRKKLVTSELPSHLVLTNTYFYFMAIIMNTVAQLPPWRFGSAQLVNLNKGFFWEKGTAIWLICKGVERWKRTHCIQFYQDTYSSCIIGVHVIRWIDSIHVYLYIFFSFINNISLSPLIANLGSPCCRTKNLFDHSIKCHFLFKPY